MKASLSARPSTWGQTRMPRKSSSTTMGGAKGRGITDKATAARAATAVMTRNDEVSTLIIGADARLRESANQ